MANEETYAAWQARMQRVILPKWTELPNFDLYMDQVLLLINETLQPLDVDPVTAAMIPAQKQSKSTAIPASIPSDICRLSDLSSKLQRFIYFSVLLKKVWINRSRSPSITA